MIGNWNYGTGRRKTSVARVFMKKGAGKIVPKKNRSRPSIELSSHPGQWSHILEAQIPHKMDQNWTKGDKIGGLSIPDPSGML